MSSERPRTAPTRSAELVKILARLHGGDGVYEQAMRIGAIYRGLQSGIVVSGSGTDKDDKGQSETDEPWKLPGQNSQDPKQAPPPKREREQKDNETA